MTRLENEGFPQADELFPVTSQFLKVEVKKHLKAKLQHSRIQKINAGKENRTYQRNTVAKPTLWGIKQMLQAAAAIDQHFINKKISEQISEVSSW